MGQFETRCRTEMGVICYEGKGILIPKLIPFFRPFVTITVIVRGVWPLIT